MMRLVSLGLLATLQSCGALQLAFPGLRRSAASSRSASPSMMPIGVPKVAYKVPGAQYADWVRGVVI